MRKIVLFLSLCCIAIDGFSQVGINTTSPNAQLDIRSSNQATPTNTDGILIPKIDAFPLTNPTAAQQGMIVYLTTVLSGKQPGFYYWDNTGVPQWEGIGGNKGWELTGNAGTDDSINFIGTTDFAPLRFRVINENAGKIDGNGSGSVFFGFKSGQNDGLYNSNAAFGNLSLFTNTSGQENVAIGDTSMYFNQSGSNNMAVGRSTLKANTTGSANAAIGSYSLFSNLSGMSNTANGGFSLYSNITGNENTAIGKSAMYGGSAGNNNVAVGFESLKVTSADNNTAIGYKSGINNTGANNIMIGANAVAPIATASNQMSIGNVIYGTTMTTTALGKIGIGETAPAAKLHISSATPATPSNTDGILIPRIDAFPLTNPTAAQNGMMFFLTAPVSQAGFYYWDNPSTSWKGIGANTGWGLNGNVGTLSNFIGTTNPVDVFFKRNNINSGRIADRNTAFGFNCLNPLTSGLYNVAFGVNALATNTSGLNNTAYGDGALRKNTTGGENSAFGSDALRENLLGSDNIANGFFTMSDNTNASKNIAIGRMALRNQNFSNGGVAYDTNNVAIGVETLHSNNPTIASPDINANGKANTAIGNYALRNNTIGRNNVASGYETLYSNTTGNNNTANGYRSLFSNTTGFANLAMGSNALFSNTSGSNNTATGTSALGANTTGTYNVAIGNYSLLVNSTGAENVAVGYSSLAANTIGSGNVATGSYSLNRNVVGTNNSAYGYLALFSNLIGDNNTASGYSALRSITNGNNNTSIGDSTLYTNVNGSGNVAIGYQAGYNELGSNKLYIENSNVATPLIYGEFDNDLARINGNLRVNSTTVAGSEMQVKNSNLYIHNDDANLNFGTGTGYFMLSTQDSSGGNETGGIRGDGDNVSIWSPGDGNRQLRILDEDQWSDNNGNPYDNGAEVAYIAANGQYFQVSDKDKKENIVRIENATDKIIKISGYTYQYKRSQSEIEKGQKPVSASGVLAQEIEQILPEAIQKNETGEYFVDYAALTPLLIEAIKEQNAKIKTFEKLIESIEKKLLKF